MKGYIHSLESFGSVDGPGIRFVIFTAGCRMHCRFCHNPDTWDMERGTEYEANDLIKKAMRYQSYWGKDGGITVSGGEPLLQIDFLTELFEKAKEQKIHTCLDTSAHPFTREEPFFGKFRRLAAATDLVLLDIKNIDPKGHRILTGQPNENILDCARYLSEIGMPVWIRHVLVMPPSEDSGCQIDPKAFSAREEQLRDLRTFLDGLHNIEKVEVLPYHVFGIHKWEKLGIPYTLNGIRPPTDKETAYARDLLTK